MARSLETRISVRFFWVLAGLFVVLAGGTLESAPEANGFGDKPKVILLGFDGLDSELMTQFMNDGLCPRLAELAERGGFSPLGTTNPAQSPVAWGSIVTGMNPGKTNIGGFIRRTCDHGVQPALATIESGYDGKTHTQPYADYAWFNRETQFYVLAGCALAIFALGFLVVRVVLGSMVRSRRIRLITGCVVGLLGAGAVVFFGSSLTSQIPDDVPFPYNLHQGNFFWDVLGDEGVRCVGLYAPGAYPCLSSEGTRILGGLGVPDVSGSTGTWYVYTDDDWVIQDQDTRTGGKIVKLEERGGEIRGVLFGPNNFVAEERFEKERTRFETQITELRDKEDGAGGSALDNRIKTAEKELKTKNREFNRWSRDPRQRKSTVEFTVEPDRAAAQVVVSVAGQRQTLTLGAWSDWFQVEFELSSLVRVPAILRMRLIRCDEEQIRIFVPAIDMSPEETPEYLRISSPAQYADQICDDVGLYETVGWSCITHGLKDEEISEEVFLEEIEYTMNMRETLMKRELEKGDFDVLLTVFYTPDRVQHMMYRLFDENHPLHDAERAAATYPFFGKQIALKDAIPEIYRQVDRIVGEMLDVIDSGRLGEHAALMIMSDHGFAPFYYGMNLNNFLVEKGYLKLSRNGEPIELEDVSNFKDSDYLGLVDWSRTQAYALGLGKVFINLKGREPEGIVDPADYESVRSAIIAELEAFVDPQNGRKVVKTAYPRETIFSGPFWKEGEAEFVFNHGDAKEKRRIDGFADVYLGFHRGYRVSWQTTMGGLEESIIVTNSMKWSGDHVSMDPDEVQGVFFANAALTLEGGRGVNVVDIVPTVYRIFGISVPEEVDGTPLPLVF